VAADDTKIGFESFYFVDEGSSIDWIVTNYCEEKEGELRKMEQMGIQVIRCGACT
jgi:DeoR/GlpR family transcriptional regulator of sugar metabolism